MKIKVRMLKWCQHKVTDMCFEMALLPCDLFLSALTFMVKGKSNVPFSHNYLVG